MHTDENKIFDKRNIERNIKYGIITQKDYEIYLLKLADVSDRLFNPEDIPSDSDEFETKKQEEIQGKRKVVKKKSRGKGK